MYPHFGNKECVTNEKCTHSAGWVTTKPSSFQFQSFMIECAGSLAEEPEYPTDALILPLVQLLNMAEVNHRSLSSVDDTPFDYTNRFDAEIKVKSVQAELSRWKASLPLVCQPSKSDEREFKAIANAS